MGLDPCTKLGHFEITGRLGAGGMGEVYRARDTKLGRDVAIKVLPEDFAKDADRLERFGREAKMLASLSHAHIGALYEFREDEGIRYLVLELVEGESLQDRIDRGLIHLREALPLFIQIAEALEAAHAKGIIHRDLKPGNVQLSSDGVVKVLDFGLARPVESATTPPRTRTPTEPTLPHDPNKITTYGSIIGTPSYMSPEQVRGTEIDQRSDIWALGCCLYEALTGQRPFHGDTVTDTLAQIVDCDPDWSRLPEGLPPEMVSLVHRCLEKEPRRRLRHAGDIAIALDDVLASISQQRATHRAKERRVPVAALLLFVVLVGAGVALFLLMRGRGSAEMPQGADGAGAAESFTLAEPVQVKRFPINLPIPLTPPSAADTPLALSPDGTLLAYRALTPEGARLALLRIGSLEPVIVPDSSRADRPFFSPDGQWIGYAARFGHDWFYMKAPVKGGPAVRLQQVPIQFPGAWGEDDYIYYTPEFDSGILRIPSAGGDPEPVTALEPGEGTHTFPIPLPGGHGLIYSSFVVPRVESGRVKVLDFRTGESGTLIDKAGALIYLPTGHLVYSQTGGLMAISFDHETLELTGPPFDITDPRMTDFDQAPTRLAVSASGTAVYVPGKLDEADALQLVWLDLNGKETPINLPPGEYWYGRFSPDGRNLAIANGQNDSSNLWLLDLERVTQSRLTDGPGRDGNLVWTPDGKEIIFLSDRSGRWGLYRKSIHGNGEAVRVMETSVATPVPQWISPDASTLIIQENGDLLTLALDGTQSPQPLLNSRYFEGDPQLSPDGKWLAYQCDESGRSEVYIQSFPDMGPRVQISTESGVYPHWVNGDINRLRYFQVEPSKRLMEVELQFEPTVSVNKPRMLFEYGNAYFWPLMHPDGDRYLLHKYLGGEAPRVGGTEVIVVENWFEEVKRREHQETPMAGGGN